MFRGFAEQSVRFSSSDGTELVAAVFTPCTSGGVRGSGGTSQTDDGLKGHALVLVHAHPKLGGTSEMMTAIGSGQHVCRAIDRSVDDEKIKINHLHIT